MTKKIKILFSFFNVHFEPNPTNVPNYIFCCFIGIWCVASEKAQETRFLDEELENLLKFYPKKNVQKQHFKCL